MRRVALARAAPLVTLAAPHVRARLDLAGIMNTTSLALLPCVLIALVRDASAFLPLLLASLAAVLLWEWIFARTRSRPRLPGALLTALLFTLLLPATLSWWQAVVGLSFGVVIGKEIFGGTGRNIVHPSVVGLTFVALAWPDAMVGAAVWMPAPDVTWSEAFLGERPGPMGASSPLACLLGAAYLLVRRLISWRTLVAVVAGVALAAWLFESSALAAEAIGHTPAHWHLVLGSLAFGTIFLATDPVTSPMTNPGRWIHGLLLGGVIVLVRSANPAHPEGTIAALLLGSIFAPLNDAVVVWGHTMWRRHRHG